VGGPLSVGEPQGDERPGRPAGVYVGEQSWATGRPLRLPSPPARWGSARGFGFGSGRRATSSSGPIAGAYARRRKPYAYGLGSSVFGVLRRHLARPPRLPPGVDSRSPPLARRAATIRHAIRALLARGCGWPESRRVPHSESLGYRDRRPRQVEFHIVELLRFRFARAQPGRDHVQWHWARARQHGQFAGPHLGRAGMRQQLRGPPLARESLQPVTVAGWAYNSRQERGRDRLRPLWRRTRRKEVG